MKTIQNIVIGACVATIALILGCKAYSQFKLMFTEKRTETSVSILSDVTDPRFMIPDMNEILTWQGFSEVNQPDMWNGISIRVSALSDIDLNKIKWIKLESVNPWLSNEFERAKEISRFREKANGLVQDLKVENGRNQSSIIEPIFQEALRLAGEPADQKILIIYSDLLQNASGLTLYNPSHFRQFTNETDSLNYLIEKYPLPESLNGMKIYLIYEPMNSIENERYMKVSEIFKKYFEYGGATVIRRANLID